MTKYQRALQIWALLVCAARERKTYTYGEVAGILGWKGAGVMAQFLDPVMRYCEHHDLPPLTTLVVNQATGLPGEGLSTVGDVNADREKVFGYEWFSVAPPESADFSNAASRQPGD